MNRVCAPSLSLLIAALLAAGGISGCGSLAHGKGQFSCQGHPSHPLCLPTSKVYALTESSEPIPSAERALARDAPVRALTAQDRPSDATPTSLELFTGAAKRAPRPLFQRQQATPAFDLQPPPRLPDGLEPFPGIAHEDLLLPRSTDPLPLRLPAQVMRLWLAPWEDERGDLHASGYVYTEIAPRTWTLAEGPTRFSNALLRPLQIAERREAGMRPDPIRHRANAGSAPRRAAGASEPSPLSLPTPRSQP